MPIFKFTFVGTLILLALQLSGQTVPKMHDSVAEHIYTLNDLEYFIDVNNELKFAEISADAFTYKFQKHASYQNKDFQIGASYWIRFPIQHSKTSEKIWLIEFYDQTIDSLEVYVPQLDGGYTKYQMGDHLPFSERSFMHKNFEVLVEAKADTTLIYYFKIQSHEFADVRIVFRSVDRFVYYVLIEYLLFGMFYGMILIISLYNFLVYLAIREVKYIYYIFYIISVGLYALSIDGIGFQYIWPNNPEWNDYASGISLYLLIFWALVFTRRFLSTKANSPSLDKALKWAIIIRTIVFLGVLLFFPELFSHRNIEIIPLSLIFYTGIRVLYKGYRPARFFVIAYGLLFMGFFLRSLVSFNLLPFTILSHYSLHISFALEMLFLTIALGDRIHILKDNRDRALRRIIHQHELNMQLKDKVNRELEEKVQERTTALNTKNTELEQSNLKLINQAVEINQINSILDLDNWKLKNRIKEVLNERLQNTIMDYEEFNTLYPDTLSCYRLLEDLKWQKNYQCSKCGNEKYFKGAQKFSRRCTRCGYNESITSFTIFKGIKFPIEKAFYIAYLAVTGRKESTLEALAQKLDLGINTVWAFKTKVNARITELERTDKKPVTSRWEEVILEPATRRKQLKNLVRSS